MDILDEMESSSLGGSEIVAAQDMEDRKAYIEANYPFMLYARYNRRPAVRGRFAVDIAMFESLFERALFIDSFAVLSLDVISSKQEDEDISKLAVETSFIHMASAYTDVDVASDRTDVVTLRIRFKVADIVPASDVLAWLTGITKIVSVIRGTDSIIISRDGDALRGQIELDEKEIIGISDDMILSWGWGGIGSKIKDIYTLFSGKEGDEDVSADQYIGSEEYHNMTTALIRHSLDNNLGRSLFHRNYRKRITSIRRSGFIYNSVVHFKDSIAYDSLVLKADSLVNLARRAKLLDAILCNLNQKNPTGLDSRWESYATTMSHDVTSYNLKNDMSFYNEVTKWRSDPIDDFSLMWETKENMNKLFKKRIDRSNFRESMEEIEKYVNSVDFSGYELMSDGLPGVSMKAAMTLKEFVDKIPGDSNKTVRILADMSNS